MVLTPADFPTETSWGSFCTRPCTYKHQWCGHLCALACHSPTTQAHTAQEDCPELLSRPCADHSAVPLRCGGLHSTARQNGRLLPYPEAMAGFRCEVEVDHARECGHTITLKCHERADVLAPKTGGFTLPACVEPVGDFCHPECGHTRSVTCDERRRFEANPPSCMERVRHARPCGCRQKMECWQSIRETNTPSDCNTDKEAPRPRCAHTISLRCHEVTALRTMWDNQDGLPAETGGSGDTLVTHGFSYGPPESTLMRRIPQCLVSVRYGGPCGHVSSGVPCAKAFEFATGATPTPRCETLDTFSSPICSHDVRAACWVAQSHAVREFGCPFVAPRSEDDDAPTAHEDSLAPLKCLPIEELRALARVCRQKVFVARRCGHRSRIPCNQLASAVKNDALPVCQEPTPRDLRCGHSAIVPCNRARDAQEPACRETVPDAYTYPCGRSEHSVQPGTCERLEALRALENPQCPTAVTCRRYRCSHKLDVPCWLEDSVTQHRPGKRAQAGADGATTVLAGVGYCGPALSADVAACCELVTFQHSPCGHPHHEAVSCDRAFAWAEATPEDAPKCNFEVELDSPLCGHELHVRCWEKRLLREWIPWPEGAKPTDQVTDAVDESMVCPVVMHTDVRPAALPTDLALSALRCGGFSCVVRACGHSERVPCISVSAALATGHCAEEVVEVCERCEHVKVLTCHNKQTRDRSGVQPVCANKVWKECMCCKINQVEIECSKSSVECRREATCTLPCGHDASWMCGGDGKDGLDPRSTPDECIACVLPKWAAAKDASVTCQGLVETLRCHALSMLPSTTAVCEQHDLKPPIKHLVQAWRNIINSNHDLFQEALENSEPALHHVCDPPALDDASSYDAVFCGLDESDESAKGAFSLSPLRYGQGVLAHKLSPSTASALSQLPAGDDGSIRICLGVALRCHALEGMPPFRADRVVDKSKKGWAKAKSKDEQKANKQMKKQRAAGYDHVVPVDSNAEAEARRIYWEPGSVLKLAVLRLQVGRKSCCVCAETFASDAEGVYCTGEERHFACSECIDGHVKANTDDEGTRLFTIRGGFYCVAGCPVLYSVRDLAKALPEGGFERISKAKERILEQQISSRLERENETRMKDEIERLANLSEAQRLLERHRHKVIDDVLTLRCPRCKNAFLDFDGCAALSCATPACGCGFCAFCLEDCGNDAHEHCLQCQYGNGGYFITTEAFDRSNKARRTRQLQEYLRRIEDEQVRSSVLVEVANELRDLNMNAEDFER